jgi:hypothetical protein
MRRITPFLLAVILLVCAPAAHAQCTGSGVPTLPATCAFSMAGVTSTNPPSAANIPANAPVALQGIMTFSTTNCAATYTYILNFNGTISVPSSPSTGTYSMTANGTGSVTFADGSAFQIAADSPGATAGTETQLRLLYIAPDYSGASTTSLILVGTCKTQ